MVAGSVGQQPNLVGLGIPSNSNLPPGASPSVPQQGGAPQGMPPPPQQGAPASGPQPGQPPSAAANLPPLPQGRVYVVDRQGQVHSLPQEQLQAAMAQGYTPVK